MPDCTGCKQLGVCCAFSVKEGNTLWILPSYRCRFLDKKTNLCTIYEKRHIINPECASMSLLRTHGAVPPKCNYLATMSFRYKGRVASVKNEKRLFKKLLKMWKKDGTPFSYSEE